MSHIRNKLESQAFTVMVEAAVPGEWDRNRAVEQFRRWRVLVDFVVLTDNLAGRPGLSPLAWAQALDTAHDLPQAVMELDVRDRNRIALLSDFASGRSGGITTFLAAAGEYFGENGIKEAKGVYDVDPLQLTEMVTSRELNRSFSTEKSQSHSEEITGHQSQAGMIQHAEVRDWGLGVTLAAVPEFPELTASFFGKASRVGADFVIFRFPSGSEKLTEHLISLDVSLPVLIQVGADEEGVKKVSVVREQQSRHPWLRGIHVSWNEDQEKMAKFVRDAKKSV